MSNRQLPIQNISAQANFLWIDEKVDNNLSWDDHEYEELVGQLFFGKECDTFLEKESTTSALSLLTGGRSSAKVLRLSFSDGFKRTATFIIRSHLSKKDVKQEEDNVKRLKLHVNRLDCFVSLVQGQFDLPNRYLLIYDDVSETTGEPVDELSQALLKFSKSNDNETIITCFHNFQNALQQMIKRYGQVEESKNKKVSLFYENISSKLPPDLVIRDAGFYEVNPKVDYTGFQNGNESISCHVGQPEIISITDILQQLGKGKKAPSEPKWFQIKEAFVFEEETPLTGDGKIAYLPFKIGNYSAPKKKPLSPDILMIGAFIRFWKRE